MNEEAALYELYEAAFLFYKQVGKVSWKIYI